MEISLSKICGGDDIVTPISFEDELVRQDMGGCLPQNYGDPREEKFRALIRGRKPKLRKFRHNGTFFNHSPAVAIREHLSPEIWNSYFTFSIERHPYEKAVSYAHYHARKRFNWNFDNQLRRTISKGYYAGYPIYCEGDAPIVDFIVNFERLDEDLAFLSEKLNFDVAENYPHTKNQHRPTRKSARDVLSDEQKEEIYRRCRVEFETLGFER